MPYLEKFSQDVFISYAHLDDDKWPREHLSWVAQLEEDLKGQIKAKLRQDPDVWRDKAIRGNEDFEQVIVESLARAATLLCVVSETFLEGLWCRRELEEFTQVAEHNMGLQIGPRSRIFKVEKSPVDEEHSELLKRLQGTGTYKFYKADQEGRLRPFRPQLNDDDSLSYGRMVDDLATDIAATLKKMKQGVASASKCVYLAATTADMDDEAKDMRRELQARGYTVLPFGDRSPRAKEFQEHVRQDLSRSALSIHLVGSVYGSIPEGEVTRSNAWIENDLAAERALDKTFQRVIWMRPGLMANDPRQNAFLEHLQKDASVDMQESTLDSLKRSVVDKLDDLKNTKQRPAETKSEPAAIATRPASLPAPPASAVTDPLRIYVVCDKDDIESPQLTDLSNCLYDAGFECILPTKNCDESHALQEHTDNLDICDACIIYFGQGSPDWYSTKLRELRKIMSTRTRPMMAKAIYMAAPASDCKRTLRTHEALVLRDGETFSPTCLEPFLTTLRSQEAAKRASA